MKLDALDEAIIDRLQEDGTLSTREIAKLCGTSVPTAYRRIGRLRRNDVIRIVAVADPFKRGYPVVAIINMQIDQSRAATVKAAVAEMKELRFAGVTVGAFDMVAEGWFKSNQEMLRFTSDVLSQVPGIIRVEPLQIYEMVTYAYDWGKSRAGPPRLVPKSKKAGNAPRSRKQATTVRKTRPSAGSKLPSGA